MNNIATFYVVRGIGLLFFAWLFSWYIYPIIKEIIRIQRTPTVHISALPFEGQVEVVGKPEGETILSPFAQDACVLWQVDVQLLGRQATTIHTEIFPKSFYVNDGTGKIQIIPAGAYLILDKKRKSSRFFPMDIQGKNILETIGIDTTGYQGYYKSFRLYERIIEPAEEIYVLGEIEYRNGTRTIVTTESTPEIISDHSQQELLGKLYLNATVRVFVLTVISFIIWSYISST